jgi:hypothetical protein
MFLKANAQGIGAFWLIDTGATLTLGKTLNVSGKREFTLKVGNFSSTMNAAVADLTVDRIIGLDFLTEYSR